MPVKRVLGGFAALAGTMFVTQVIGFAALVVAARELGPANLGAATFALNLAFYFAIPANFGLALMAIRDIARDPDNAPTVIGHVLILRGALAIVTSASLVALAPVIAPDPKSQALIPLAALTILLDAVNGEWTLLGAERRVAVAFARMAGQVAYGVLVVLFITGGLEGGRRFVEYTVLSVLITSLLTRAYAWRVVGRPRFGLDWQALRRRARESAPLGIAVVMSLIYISIGAIMLGYFKGPSAVGQYSVGWKIPLALLGVAQLWSATLYPQVAKLISDRRDELRAQIKLFTSLGIAVALPLGVGGTIVGHDLIPALFGSRYGPAGDAFSVMIWALALSLLTYNIGTVLAAGGAERRYAVGRTLGAAVAVGVNVVAIPLAGLMGAAAAVVAAEFVVLAYMIYSYRPLMGAVQVDGRRVVGALIASAAMAGALLVVGDSVGVGVRLVIGAGVYVAAALAGGVVRPDELAPLLRRRQVLVTVAEDPAAGPRVP
jgi:O-antigen/teichoic acid export membrane protein